MEGPPYSSWACSPAAPGRPRVAGARQDGQATLVAGQRRQCDISGVLWHHDPSAIRRSIGITPPYVMVVVLPAYGLTTPRAHCMPPCAHADVAMGGSDTASTPGYAQRRSVAQRCLPHRFVPRHGLQ